MKLVSQFLFLIILFATCAHSQVNYNRICFTADFTIGNGVYGIGSMKIGIESPFLNNQKLGLRIGAGLDISEKIGFGATFSPHQFKYFDILLACDLTRMFGSTVLYRNDEDTYSEDLYSFDNTNLIIPSIEIRAPGADLITFHITYGWAFGLNSPNIELISGPGIEISSRNIKNRLIGGYRFEFGATFRLRNWKNQP